MIEAGLRPAGSCQLFWHPFLGGGAAGWSFYISLLIMPSLSESLSIESQSFMIVREAFTQIRLSMAATLPKRCFPGVRSMSLKKGFRSQLSNWKPFTSSQWLRFDKASDNDSDEGSNFTVDS
jgi:hypothetical protein